MTPEEAIKRLKQMDKQIIHGSRIFSDIAEVIENLCADSAMLDYLGRKEKLQMIRNDNLTDFLELAEDGTTCWGKTYRAAVIAAMKHDGY